MSSKLFIGEFSYRCHCAPPQLNDFSSRQHASLHCVWFPFIFHTVSFHFAMFQSLLFCSLSDFHFVSWLVFVLLGHDGLHVVASSILLPWHPLSHKWFSCQIKNLLSDRPTEVTLAATGTRNLFNLDCDNVVWKGKKKSHFRNIFGV